MAVPLRDKDLTSQHNGFQTSIHKLTSLYNRATYLSYRNHTNSCLTLKYCKRVANV